MTPEHEEAFPVGEAVRLAVRFGEYFTDYDPPIATFDPSELAALIAEVRRQAMEEAAVICDDYDNGDYAADQWACAELIRARLGSPMGKEEGK